MLARLGGWSFRNPWKITGLWVAALIVIFGASGAIGTAFDGSFEIPESESRDGFDALETHFDGLGAGQSGSIVFRTDDTVEAGVQDPEVVAAMTTLFDDTAAIDGVDVVSPYTPFGAQQISDDGTVAFATVNLASDIDMTESGEIGVEIREASPEIDGVQIEIGGAILAEFEPPETELIGLAFAVVILIVSFGSVLAMGLPIGVAVAGVGTGAALIGLVSNLTSMPDFATTIGAMIGLGVGIDYALFIITRYREGLAAGYTPEAATRIAMDTAGRAVIFAGVTVVVSLLGMLIIGLPFVSGLGIGASITVGVTMIASVTLLPGLLGFAGERVELTRWRGLIAAGLVAVSLLGIGIGVPALTLVCLPLAIVVLVAGLFVRPLRRLVPERARRPMRQTLAYRWSRAVQARPWTAAIAGVVILLALAAPVLGLRLGFSDEGNYPEDTTTRQAYDILAEGFGPGFNGPFLVSVVLGSPQDAAAVDGLVAALSSADGVAGVGQPLPSDMADPAASEAFLIQVVPETAPQSAETAELVESLRSDVVPAAVEGTTLDVDVTGMVPANIDFNDYLSGRVVIFLGAVLALSFVLLMAVFRSVLVPLKAVIMNMLSISAAYGVVVAIFQWGWLGDLFGVEGAPIEPFIPMMLFAIVFGLSMDYEVFLLSRIKEQYERSGDAIGSVSDGLAMTARVITAAAAIMVVVFGSFIFEDDRIIKLFGVGLAMAVLLDATLVRMLLVPATMELLGERNWWLPGWLDRILPDLNVEGGDVAASLPAPGNGADPAVPPGAAPVEPEAAPVPVGD